MIHALYVGRLVSLHKLAASMPSDVGRDSNMRRLQRFLAEFVLDFDLIARMILSILPVDRHCLEHGPHQLEVRQVQYKYP